MDMSFGKRGAGGGDPRPLPPSSEPSESLLKESVAPNVRMSVANPGGFDLRFAVLAVGVMAIAAAGALGITMIGGGVKVRPVAEIVAGLNRDQLKAALAVEALPDKQGQVFMATLQKHFPSEHDKLLGLMADTAMRGGDRNSLAIEVNEWLFPFTMQNMSNLGRTGAAGFDFALDAGDYGLDYISHTAGGCTVQSLTKLETVFSDPNQILEEIAYGSKGYEFNIKMSTQLVLLADAGRGAPNPPTELKPQDEAALRSALFSLMMDRDVMEMIRMAQANQSLGQVDTSALSRVDVCRLGHTAIDKLRKLPKDTKGRLWGVGMNELRKMVGPIGFRIPAPGQFGPGQFPSAQYSPGQLTMR
jgi:hypothetical protein